MSGISSRKYHWAEMNGLPAEEFVAGLGGIYEHSPWVAEIAAGARPFGSQEDLRAAMARAVAESGAERQLALINAHPDLAGRLAQQGLLTPESSREQAAAGLASADAEALGRIEALNGRYRGKFGFPFIICARLNNVGTIVAAMEARLGNERKTEIAAALAEIDKIAALRLGDLIEE